MAESESADGMVVIERISNLVGELERVDRIAQRLSPEEDWSTKGKAIRTLCREYLAITTSLHALSDLWREMPRKERTGRYEDHRELMTRATKAGSDFKSRMRELAE